MFETGGGMLVNITFHAHLRARPCHRSRTYTPEDVAGGGPFPRRGGGKQGRLPYTRPLVRKGMRPFRRRSPRAQRYEHRCPRGVRKR